MDDRVRRDLRMEQVVDRGFDRLVVLGERTVVQRRGEEPSDALGQHDERAELARRRVGLDVGHVADPLLAVPDDARPLGVPGLAFRVGGRAVVHDAAVGGPGEGPVVEHAEARRIGGRPALGVVAGLGVDARVEPVAAHRRAVVLELTEAVELLAGGAKHLGLVLRDPGCRRAPCRSSPSGPRRGRARRDSCRSTTTFSTCSGSAPPSFCVEVAHREEDARQDLLVGTRLAGRIEGLPLPLQPAGRVGEGPVLLGEARGRKLEDLGLDLRGVGRRRTPWAPSRRSRSRCRRFSPTTSHLSFESAAMHLGRVGPDADRDSCRR